MDRRPALADRVLSDAVHEDAVRPHLIALTEVTLHLPIEVADYVDFYASGHHATNVGRMFRPDSEPLTPNWKHLPIGYHGRSGTVVVSGTDVVRPSGQRKAPSDPAPVFGPSRKLDIEAELGFVVGGSTVLGESVDVSSAAESHLFGVVVLNDWSARDIQAWEYVPLGPFLGKSFGTSISAWVTPMAALEAAQSPSRAGPPPAALPAGRPGSRLRARHPCRGRVERVRRVAPRVPRHVLVAGADAGAPDRQRSIDPQRRPVRLGHDLRGGADSRGSFLELSWNGTEPVTLADGSERTFLEDGDTVVLRAWAAGADGARIGLGEVSGRIVRPAETIARRDALPGNASAWLSADHHVGAGDLVVQCLPLVVPRRARPDRPQTPAGRAAQHRAELQQRPALSATGDGGRRPTTTSRAPRAAAR